MSETQTPARWNKNSTRTSEHGMTRPLSIVTAAASLAGLALIAGSAIARSPVSHQKVEIQEMAIPEQMHLQQGAFMDSPVPSQPLTLQGMPLGAPRAPASADQAVLSGSPIASVDGGLLIVDADSGKLLRVAAGETTATAELEIGRGVSQVVVHPDGSRAFVADREHDEVVVIDLSSGLSRVDAYRTRTEPYGLAITPDGKSLLVTTVADRSLTALDLGTGSERWTIEVGPEPRGVAIAPDGSEALVTFLTTGAVARVGLAQTARPRASYISLDPGVRASVPSRSGAPRETVHSDEGKSFARNAFAVGYVGHGLAVVPHQLSTPHLASDDVRVESSGYGGGNGFTSPITHRLAFLDTPEGGSTGTRVTMGTTMLHQPRALAYDGRSDTLYVAGFGSDQVASVANVSQASVASGWVTGVTGAGGSCGPTGLAVVPDSGEVAVWCSLTRNVVWLAPDKDQTNPKVSRSTLALADSRLSTTAQRGRELFRTGNSAQLSQMGAMACSSCHAEVRADGLSWRLQGKNLQTPLLAGRIEGAHPFKWDGKDPTITDSLTNTVTRLGGSGISPTQAKELAAFLKTVDAPRKPAVADASAVARGKALFASDATGCATCHNGPLMTDQQSYDLSTDLGKVDTPSLVGLATSAPYYHDGSAATLDALLAGNANVHGMGRISKLSDGDIGDLVQYLKTL